jgi:predicted Rossmann fold nucleotide-binding protein DprA/Smf involved in DNA uptake
MILDSFSESYLNAELNLIQRRETLMRELKKDLQSVLKSLRALTQKTEKMIRQLRKLDKAQAAKKPKARAAKRAIAKKPTRVSATDTVLAIIKRSRKGVHKATLINKTGLKGSNIRTILYRLRKQGKVKSDPKGIYVKA